MEPTFICFDRWNYGLELYLDDIFYSYSFFKWIFIGETKFWLD